jgi:hypothetical protein
VNADICLEGASAYLEWTQGSQASPAQILAMINTNPWVESSSGVRFSSPANATGAELIGMVGVGAASPGTYAGGTAGNACGSLTFCTYLPVPASVDCDGGTPSACPAGCALEGPIMGPSCTPVTPEECYSAGGVSGCASDAQTPEGSWTLTLTSVTPYNGATGPGAYYVIHGTFSANMIGGDDAGTGSETLTLSF